MSRDQNVYVRLVTLNTTYRRKQNLLHSYHGKQSSQNKIVVRVCECVRVCLCVFTCVCECLPTVCEVRLFMRCKPAHPVTCLCTCPLIQTPIDTGTSHQPPCPPTLILAKPATHPARAQRHLATAQSQPQLLPLTFSLTTQSTVYTLIHNFPIVTTTHWLTSGATGAAVTSLLKPRHKI